MGRLYAMVLEDAAGKMYSCKHCQTHLAASDQIVSKSFHCKHGRAYLFSKVVNVSSGINEDRLMMTGMHTVADIFCVKCGSIVGWKYIAAHEKAQKYKEGKFILERFKIAGPDGTNYWAAHDSEVNGSSDAEEEEA
ncbi:Protein yippee-like [Zostera marina]|uniref:Protein yippee-like n=1 Tax=Zostera marina TaxID=29655 RepID=A0A0K9NLU9_ZOSMR|nr:Protein yippee-like [Zostera marina]